MGAAEGRASLRRLLVPLDGSRLAECVLPLGVSLAAHLDARLTLLHVLERQAPSTVHGERHLTGAEEAEGYLNEVSARVLASGVAVDRHVHPNEEDDVAKSIVDHADDLGADLIVLCTHGGGGTLPGRRAFHRVLFGSVAQQVLGRGLRPVLLVRPPDALASHAAVSPELERLLVPLDGESAAEAALPLAATLAAAYRAEVVLRRVVPTLSTLGGERGTAARLVPTAAAASLDLEEGEAVRYLEDVAARPLLEGLRINASVIRGDPAQTLLDVAAQIAADMIVMVTHGRSGLDAVLTGSVASRIAARFLKPLLLVRAPRGGSAPPAGTPS